MTFVFPGLCCPFFYESRRGSHFSKCHYVLVLRMGPLSIRLSPRLYTYYIWLSWYAYYARILCNVIVSYVDLVGVHTFSFENTICKIRDFPDFFPFLQSCFYDIWLDPKTILIIFQFCFGLSSFRKWFAYLVSSRHNFSSHRKSKN